jgi:hypothetical protein
MTRDARRCNVSRQRLELPLTVFVALLLPVYTVLAQSNKVDGPDSQSLTTYLRQHRLPLVGAQVLVDSSGNRRIVLYGFVATEFGKDDAARQALAYVGTSAHAGTSMPSIENRIEIRPEIARMNNNAAPGAGDAGHESLDQVLDEIDRFGITMAPAATKPK